MPWPDFDVIALLQRFIGDHVVSTVSSHPDLRACAPLFAGGETGIVLVNRWTEETLAQSCVLNHRRGERLYVYRLIGVPGRDEAPDLPLGISMNGVVPDPSSWAWGPLEEFEGIPADAYPVGEEVRVEVPARSLFFDSSNLEIKECLV